MTPRSNREGATADFLPSLFFLVWFLSSSAELANAEYSGNITVPVLFDKKTNRIVNNESSEIIQMLNAQFNAFSATPSQAALDLYPSAIREEVDETNAWIYPQINNGVYKVSVLFGGDHS
jgi:putative glutathione S-transferase